MCRVLPLALYVGLGLTLKGSRAFHNTFLNVHLSLQLVEVQVQKLYACLKGYLVRLTAIPC